MAALVIQYLCPNSNAVSILGMSPWSFGSEDCQLRQNDTVWNLIQSVVIITKNQRTHYSLSSRHISFSIVLSRLEVKIMPQNIPLIIHPFAKAFFYQKKV